MKITEEQMVNTVLELVGEEVEPIVQYLWDKKDISEFQIASHLQYEVNTVRHLLYRMFGYHIVTYHRKKDRIKGWYISYWTLNFSRMRELVIEVKRKKIDQLRDKLSKEESNQNLFYLCPQLCIRADFDKAVNLGFHCPECGSLLSQQDNSKTIENIRQRIEEAESELAQLKE